MWSRRLAIASDERIEAFVLYRSDGTLLSLRSLVDDGGAGLGALLRRVTSTGLDRLTLAKVHPGEIQEACLEALGFRPAGRHRRFSALVGAVQAAPREAP